MTGYGCGGSEWRQVLHTRCSGEWGHAFRWPTATEQLRRLLTRILFLMLVIGIWRDRMDYVGVWVVEEVGLLRWLKLR